MNSNQLVVRPLFPKLKITSFVAAKNWQLM